VIEASLRTHLSGPQKLQWKDGFLYILYMYVCSFEFSVFFTKTIHNIILAYACTRKHSYPNILNNGQFCDFRQVFVIEISVEKFIESLTDVIY
jgi:hypothetical protein